MHDAFFIFGAPGAGKSTLLRAFISTLNAQSVYYKHDLITGHWFVDHSLLILGEYTPEERFPGTDRWSMGAQRSAHTFWQEVSTRGQILGEGSRIATRPFIEVARDYVHLSLIFLEITREIAAQRRVNRSQQNATWAKGVETRITNLASTYQQQLPCLFWRNEDTQDLIKNVNALHTLLI